MRRLPPMSNDSISKILHDIELGRIKLDLYFQRNDDQWSNEQKSLLIHSIFYNYPIPPLYFYEKNDTKYLFDGLQRLTAIQEFKNNKLRLNKITPPIEYSEKFRDKVFEDTLILADKTYNDLVNDSFADLIEELFDNKIINYFNIPECTDEEQAEIFQRLNNGIKMSNAQKTFSYIGKDYSRILKTISQLPIFTENANITLKQKKDSNINNIILNTAMLLCDFPYVKLTPKKIKEFASKLKRQEIDYDMNSLQQIFEKLSDSIPANTGKIKNLKIYQIVLMAYNVKIAEELNIPLCEYGKWIVDFLNQSQDYPNYFDSKNLNNQNELVKRITYIKSKLTELKENLS